jgi:hypothetical protein
MDGYFFLAPGDALRTLTEERDAAQRAVMREGLNVLSQYTELLKGGEVASATEIPAGSGAVVGWGPTKVATYRQRRSEFGHTAKEVSCRYASRGQGYS